MSGKNEEKAHAMLNRWVAMKKELNSKSKDKRPYASAECNNLQECERWRSQIIKEITKKVADIQNASLGEYKVREINDEINKLFKEKSHWEERIKELGGPDYKKLAPKAIDAQGYELHGFGGYKYWGAAKDLPGVRELFAKEVPNAPKKSRTDMYKNINFEYYGFKDDEDGTLKKLEKDAEEILLKEYQIELAELDIENSKKKQRLDNLDYNNIDNNSFKKQSKKLELFNEDEYLKFKFLHTPEDLHKSFVNKPSDIEVEKLLLEKKKRQLIRMFDLDEFQEIVKVNEKILKHNKVDENNYTNN